jgi:hypothetical protein
MYKDLFLAALIASIVTSAAAEDPRNTGSGSDFRAIVPADWKLSPPDPIRRDRRFVSPTGDAWLALSGRPAEGEAVSAHMNEVLSGNGERITYQRLDEDLTRVYAA